MPRKIIGLLLPLLLWLFIVGEAYAVTVSEQITIQTSAATPASLTLTAGSSFDSMTVQAGGFEFTLSGTQKITLRASNRAVMTNTAGVKFGCEGTYSELILSASNGGTIGVGVEGFACSGGGGSGPAPTTSSSGGGGSVTTTTTTTTTTTSAATSTPSTATSTPSTTATTQPTESSTPSSSQPVPTPMPYAGVASLSRSLSLGSEGEDVTMLQQALASMPDIYPEGTVSGYFGGLTRAAVQRFQEKYGIASSGNSGYGLVGPMTRAKLKEVFE